jgi:branched-chain amino acid transport system permease protein
MSAQRFDSFVLLALAILGIVVPFFFAGYEIKLATTILVQAGLAVALGFVAGPGGLVSLGHAAFYGVAAYMLAGVAPEHEPANLLLTAALSVLGAATLAAIIGAVSIRARGLYFVLMTLAFGQLGYHFFHDTGLAGSADGRYINLRPELVLPGVVLNFDNATRFYVLVLVVVASSVALVWWLRRSAFGSILVAARDNETRVRAFGFSPYGVRLAAFIISGALAGLMGYLNAAQHGFVAPQLLGWHLSATVLVMVLIGGKDTVSGPLVGAILLLVAEEVMQRLTEHWLAGVGLIIVAVVLLAPRGLVPAVASLFGGARAPQEGRRG